MQGLSAGLIISDRFTLVRRLGGGGMGEVWLADDGELGERIALKLLDMHRAVNITLGLPIVRTSVAHGTAFDLAWQGRAESSGMVEALRVAASLARV